MKDDEIGMIIKQDKIIRHLGVELYKKNGKESLAYVQVNIREIAKLVHALRQNNRNRIMCMKDILKPSMFDQVIEVVHELSTGLHGIPSLVSRIGYLLKKCGQIYLGVAICDQDKSVEKDVTDFLQLYDKEYSQKLSSIVCKTRATEKQNKMEILSITQDIIKLQKYVHEMMYLVIQTYNPKNDFKDLATITLSHLIMFNTTRSEDVSRMLISDFISRPDTTSTNCDLMSPTEKKLTERLCLVDIHRKRGRGLPVLVPPDAVKAINLLVDADNRKNAEINPENNFVFPISENSTDNINGHDALSSTVDTADLKAPETIKNTLLRRFIAKVSQILIMNENEMDWLVVYLGCDRSIQQKFDRLRHYDVELAKVAKLLYAVDTGKIHKLSGKNLDEIDIDGDIQDLIGESGETEDKTVAESGEGDGGGGHDDGGDDDNDDGDDNDDDADNDDKVVGKRTITMEAGVTNKRAKRQAVPKNEKSFVSTSLNNKEGRKWNRKNCCLFCGKQQAKFVRHLTRKHSKEIEVQKLLSFPKGSSKRLEEAKKLKHLGNYQHNIGVLENGKGELLVAKRPKRRQVSAVSDYAPCVHCKGFFVASLLWRHSKVCESKDNSLDHKGGALRVGKTLVAVCENSDWSDDLFLDMKDDEIGMIIKQDKIIRHLGVELYKKNSKESLAYVQVKIREIAKLVNALRQNNRNGTMCMTEILKPSMFDQVIEAVHELSTGLHGIPSLVSRIGYLLKRCGQIYLGVAIRDQDKSAEKDVTDFLRLYDKEYSQKLSSIVRKTRATEKQNKMEILSITQDIVKLQKYVHEMMYLVVQTYNPKNDFKDLASITLSHLIMFNTTRSEDVSRMLISDFISRPDTTSTNCDLLSPTEKQLTERLCLVHIHRKRGRSLPILIPPDAVNAIVLLVDADNRKNAEINPDNNFVFPISENSTDNINGHDALSSTVDTADLKAPETIKSTLLRRFTAKVSQILIMNENEMDWLAVYLGCDRSVQQKFDKLRQDDVELAKVAKILYAVDTGKIHKFTGKNLDEIDVDGDIQDWIGESGSTEDKTHADSYIDDGDDDVLSTAVNRTSTVEAGVTDKRRAVKRNGKLCFHVKWGDKEKNFVRDYFRSNISDMNVSGVGKARCEDALKKGGSLFKNRTWVQVKSCVKNLINKNKKKITMQSGL
ncbi:uncharacterized protein LOC126816141 isoform X3 [Patella vulgata]|uniref:uncharacterized protein LOC126816141 isoform X3 n=1 Tax=Patella vulgata TaxID=6465 RepID=UPI00217F92D8|nr:uncharacterized protein LOC126816141 isoform X3 [Patella vulgata]